MKTEDIPYDYTYCYATDEQCQFIACVAMPQG